MSYPKKAKIVGKGKKKNGKSSIWKNPAFLGLIGVISAAVIAGIFQLISTLISSPSKTDSQAPVIHQETKGEKSPAIFATDDSRVTVTHTEASPDLLDRLERASIERGKQAQIIEERDKKIKELELALKERHVSEDALARFKAREYVEAEALFTKELKEGAEKSANAAYYLGNIKFAQLNFDGALKYYQKATELEPKNSLYLNGVGIAYYTLGKYQEAIKHFEQALSIDKKFYGERHPDVATDLNNLGSAWDSLGKYDKAIEFFEKALSICREAYGEKHPSVAASLNNLGTAWYSLGKHEKAREYLTMSYNIYVDMLGENHPDTRQTKSNLDSLPK